jgi:hypothetical protein
MHIDFHFVDYFLERTWDCREGFNMCYLCRSDLGCNGQDLRGLGSNPSSGLQNLKQKFSIVACSAHVQVVCKLLLLAPRC